MILTWLYAPGDRPQVVAKALGCGADAVIVDLEDAVPASRKEYARAATAELLAYFYPRSPSTSASTRSTPPGAAPTSTPSPGCTAWRDCGFPRSTPRTRSSPPPCAPAG